MDETPEDSEKDKRRTPRLYRRFILRAAVFGEKPLRWSFVTILNLSATGILFTYDRPVYEGMLLHIKIDFPGRVIECMGRVTRRAGLRERQCQDVAAHLENMNSEDRTYVEGFVRKGLIG